MRHHTISNTDDTLDSRDVIARIEALTQDRMDYEIDCPTCGAAGVLLDDDGGESACPDCEAPGQVSDTDASRAAWAEANEDDAAELAALTAFTAELSGYLPDWRHGETLIRDDHFADYAQELAEDIGAINRDAAWPACHIDWTAAAEALKDDYTSAELDGVTYWGRS